MTIYTIFCRLIDLLHLMVLKLTFKEFVTGSFTAHFYIKILSVLLVLHITLDGSGQTPDFHLEGDQTFLIGDSLQGTGAKYFWNGDYRALRFGYQGLHSPSWNEEYLGYNSVAWGFNTYAIESGSTSFGERSYASGNISTAWGYNTKSTGHGSTVWGSSSEASGSYSTAWGSAAKAQGPYSTTWGRSNITPGNTATAWGGSNMCGEYCSTSWGIFNKSTGIVSTSWGWSNISNSYAETVLGQYADTSTTPRSTIWSEIDQLFTVGNGLAEDDRNNAFSIIKNGDIHIKNRAASRGYKMYNSNLFKHPSYSKVQEFGPSINTGNFFITSEDAASIDQGVIYGSAETCTIFNSGDEDAFLKIVDEDNWNDNDTDPYDNGALVAFINWTGIWQMSDQRKKEKIKRLSDALSLVDKMNGYSYIIKEQGDKKMVDLSAPVFGLLAQELEKVIPQAVKRSKKDEYHVNYTMVIPVLVEAIKELTEENRRLERYEASITNRTELIEKELFEIRKMLKRNHPSTAKK